MKTTEYFSKDIKDSKIIVFVKFIISGMITIIGKVYNILAINSKFDCSYETLLTLHLFVEQIWLKYFNENKSYCGGAERRHISMC